jgi:alpha-amylase
MRRSRAAASKLPRADGLVASWQRKLKREHTLVVLNYGEAGASAALADLPAQARLVALWPQHAPSVKAARDGTAQVVVPAQGLRVYRVQPR